LKLFLFDNGFFHAPRKWGFKKDNIKKLMKRTKSARTIDENKTAMQKIAEEMLTQLEETKQNRDLNTKEIKLIEVLNIIKKLLIKF